MRMLSRVIMLVLAAALAAGCGGDDAGFLPPEDADGGVIIDPTQPALAALALLTSSPQIPSDGALPATITAQVQDVNNNFVAGALVSFAADSGGLTVDQSITGSDGKAVATLSTAGDPTNRLITVVASVTDADGTVLADSIAVDVIGTQLTLNGNPSLVLGDTATYTVVLADANGDGIANQTVDISSSNGNTLSATMLTTDATGQAQFQLTSTVAGNDTITATAIGISVTVVAQVSNDSFAFLTPVANSEIALDTNQTLTVRWTQGGAPVVGSEIVFATTRGTLVPASGFTNGSGEVSVSISSANAGPATASAVASGGPTTQLAIEFVATVANTIEVQADPFNVAPNEQATITAVVRDPNNNLVKNKTVVFELDDVTGGSLSVGAAVTDSQGRAQTFYTASPTTSASEGVIITAFVSDAPAVSDSTALTVASREVFISFGTGNEIVEPNQSQYEIEFAIQVTDADGNGVEGVDVQLSLLSERYIKGVWFLDTISNNWFTEARATCFDEDVNRNGVLDFGEDFNNSGQIEAGNVALVTPGVGTTSATGSFLVNIVYPQVHGNWLEVSLQARTDVQGTEFTESQTFILPVCGCDTNSADEAPPGILVPPDPDPLNNLTLGGLVSPWGYGSNCGDTI